MDTIKNIFSYYFVPLQDAYLHMHKNIRRLDRKGHKTYLSKNGRLNPVREEVFVSNSNSNS